MLVGKETVEVFAHRLTTAITFSEWLDAGNLAQVFALNGYKLDAGEHVEEVTDTTFKIEGCDITVVVTFVMNTGTEGTCYASIDDFGDWHLDF